MRKKRGRPEGSIIDYIVKDVRAVHPLHEFAAKPASVFLHEAVYIATAIEHCLRHFPRKGNGQWTEPSLASINQLNPAALAELMGQFELFQRFCFARLFELTGLVDDFDAEACASALIKLSRLSFDVTHMMAYRRQPAPVGQMLADQLGAWHSPERVNTHFKTLLSEVNFYSSAEIEELRILWQLRHSFVHTGGWLTLPDAQKVRALRHLGGGPLLLQEKFIEMTIRKMHRIVNNAMGRLRTAMEKRFPQDALTDPKVADFLTVNSSRPSWLPRKK